MSDYLPPLIVDIQLDLAKLKAQSEQLQTQMKAMGEGAKNAGSHFNSLGGEVRKLAAEFGLAFGAVKAIEFLKESGKAAVENQKSYGVMALALKNVTGATAEQSDAIDKQLERMALLTGHVTSDLRPSFEKLITITKDSSRSLDLLSLAQDVAVLKHKELGTVTQALSRYLAGNTSALVRIAPETKNVSNAFALLAKESKGAAETAANLDPYQRMTAAMTTIKEAVGTALIPILNKFSDWLVSIVPKVEDFFKQLNDPTTEVGKNWKDFTDTLKAAFDWFTKNYQVVLNLITLFAGLKIALGALKLAQEAATAAQWLYNIALDANPVGVFIGLLGGLAALYLVLAGNIDTATASQNGFNAATGQSQARGSRGFNPAGAGSYATGLPTADQINAHHTVGAGELAALAGPTNYGGTTGGSSKASAAATLQKQLASVKSTMSSITATVKTEQDKYAAAVTSAYKAYDAAAAAAETQRTQALAAAEKQHADNVASITKSFTDKLQSIVQQSMDRLRNTFKQVAQQDVAGIFKWQYDTGQASMDNLITVMKDKLAAAKQLVANAGALSSAGFSQTFIEQLVAAGPDTGNAMAKQILDATPDAQKQLQDLFGQQETLANTGMDSLSKAIYDKAGLATDELKKLYSDTQSELVQALADEQSAYVDQQAQIQAAFADAMAQANGTLKDSLNAAGGALNKALDDADAALTAKLATMKGKLGTLQGQIGTLKNLIGGSYVADTTPAGMSFATASGSAASTLAGNSITIKTDVTGVNMTSPAETATAVSNAVLYNLPYTGGLSRLLK